MDVSGFGATVVVLKTVYQESNRKVNKKNGEPDTTGSPLLFCRRRLRIDVDVGGVGRCADGLVVFH